MCLLSLVMIKLSLILLDVTMPGLDGIETCQRLRNILKLSNKIIAFLRARSQIYVQVAGYDAGGDDCNKIILP